MNWPLNHDAGLAVPSGAPDGGSTLLLDEADDLALIRQVAAKDRRAFEVLYYRYAPRLGRYLSRLLRQPELVEEALNDVMLVVWQSAARFDPAARLSPWLFGIAHNKALKALARSRTYAYREQTREQTDPLPEPSMDDDSDEPDDPHDPDSPERIVMRQDLGRVLTRALEGLSPEQRAVVELTYYEGFSYPEIAAITGCPVNTVKTRMFHARRRLARVLAGLGLDRSATEREEAP